MLPDCRPTDGALSQLQPGVITCLVLTTVIVVVIVYVPKYGQVPFLFSFFPRFLDNKSKNVT